MTRNPKAEIRNPKRPARSRGVLELPNLLEVENLFRLGFPFLGFLFLRICFGFLSRRSQAKAGRISDFGFPASFARGVLRMDSRP